MSNIGNDDPERFPPEKGFKFDEDGEPIYGEKEENKVKYSP